LITLGQFVTPCDSDKIFIWYLLFSIGAQKAECERDMM